MFHQQWKHYIKCNITSLYPHTQCDCGHVLITNCMHSSHALLLGITTPVFRYLLCSYCIITYYVSSDHFPSIISRHESSGQHIFGNDNFVDIIKYRTHIPRRNGSGKMRYNLYIQTHHVNIMGLNVIVTKFTVSHYDKHWSL